MLCIVQRNSAVRRESSSQRARRAVARLGLRSAQHLFEGLASHDLPHLLQVLGQANLAALRRLHTGVTAVDFQRGPDAGEDQIRAPDSLFLQPLHPVGDALRQLAENVGPIADWRIFGPRAADEMDAGFQSSGVPCS